MHRQASRQVSRMTFIELGDAGAGIEPEPRAILQTDELRDQIVDAETVNGKK